MDDWGVKSKVFDDIQEHAGEANLSEASEAQTRFDVIDRLVRDVCGWEYGQISVEERQESKIRGYVDYVLRSGDITLVIEAKKAGAAFPNPTKARSLSIKGSVLGKGEVSAAIQQALEYAKSKSAQVCVITNGASWIYFRMQDVLSLDNPKADLLFPFDEDKHAEKLFDLFSNKNIAEYQLRKFDTENSNITNLPENKLLSVVNDPEIRVGRNNITDHLAPALDGIFHSDSILDNENFLKSCFVYTTSRTKYDKNLAVHLTDTKPVSIGPARRVRTGKKGSGVESVVEYGKPASAPPVVLLVAEVGSGKTTYLKHFQLVHGKHLLKKRNVHWIYVDFEQMGRGGNIRDFLYEKLRWYLLDPNKTLKTDYEHLIEPAYSDEIEGLRTGPYALLAEDDDEFKKLVTEYIRSDLDKGEPYVDKLLSYLARNDLCVIVLDNTDLLEDEDLEKGVLSEGLALAKKLHTHVIVSIRDTTYVKHKNSSVFDAYDLKTFWLDAPPFAQVLSKRLSLSALALRRKSAEIAFSGGIKLKVPDLSKFFDIVKEGLLSGSGGLFIESSAGQNIRRGLNLVKNFLTSGHVSADKAMQSYISGKGYTFPFHEVFKGSVLGQYKYYKERRSDCINLFDARLGAENLRLLRLCILSNLYHNSQNAETAKVSVKDTVKLFSKLGANAEQIMNVLNDLIQNQLVKAEDAAAVSINSDVFITKIGAYYFAHLSSSLPYIEACMYDTAIDDTKVWNELSSLTGLIEKSHSIRTRMELRQKRASIFVKYLDSIERKSIAALGEDKHKPHIGRVATAVDREFKMALNAIARQKRRRVD